jgi:hypothetical protein
LSVSSGYVRSHFGQRFIVGQKMSWGKLRGIVAPFSRPAALASPAPLDKLCN